LANILEITDYDEHETYYPFQLQLVSDCLRDLAALQQFIFAMKYLHSATNCALTKPLVSTTCVKYTFVTVTLLYTAAIVGLCVVMVLNFSEDVYLADQSNPVEWVYLNNPLFSAQINLWAGLSIASAVIAVYSIYKIIEIVKQLHSTFYTNSLILHATLAVLQALSLSFFIICFKNVKIFFVANLCEFVSELFVSFICVTMGSHKALRDFVVTINSSQIGPMVTYNR
jgi:hypothetical protein